MAKQTHNSSKTIMKQRHAKCDLLKCTNLKSNLYRFSKEEQTVIAHSTKFVTKKNFSGTSFLV
jgi:hypothetical protein